MTTGRDDDRNLVESAREGDSEAFGALVRRYQDRLYPTLLRLTGNSEDARDLLQDAFLRAYQKLGKFHGESSFYTWVYRIAVNLALSRRRMRWARRWVSQESITPPSIPAADAERSDPTLPIELAERDAMIQRALDGLTAEHRAVVVMKDFDGLSYDEMASALGIPIGTVRSRLHRARLELHEKLAPLVEDRGGGGGSRVSSSVGRL